VLSRCSKKGLLEQHLATQKKKKKKKNWPYIALLYEKAMVWPPHTARHLPCNTPAQFPLSSDISTARSSNSCQQFFLFLNSTILQLRPTQQQQLLGATPTYSA
jgi:hypothetical protein